MSTYSRSHSNLHYSVGSSQDTPSLPTSLFNQAERVVQQTASATRRRAQSSSGTTGETFKIRSGRWGRSHVDIAVVLGRLRSMHYMYAEDQRLRMPRTHSVVSVGIPPLTPDSLSKCVDATSTAGQTTSATVCCPPHTAAMTPRFLVAPGNRSSST
jgi:hypothetical protein